MAGIACKLHHIDKGRRIIRLRLVRGFYIIRYRRRVSRAAVGKPHGQSQPLPHNGPFQEYVAAVIANLSRNDFIGKFFYPFIHRPFRVVSHAGHFPEYPVPDFLYTRFYASHGVPP